MYFVLVTVSQMILFLEQNTTPIVDKVIVPVPFNRFMYTVVKSCKTVGKLFTDVWHSHIYNCLLESGNCKGVITLVIDLCLVTWLCDVKKSENMYLFVFNSPQTANFSWQDETVLFCDITFQTLH